MNRNKSTVTVEAVERKRATLYLTWNLFIKIIETKNKSNKNLYLKRIGYICNEKEMIGYGSNNRSYREIAYHFVK